MPDNAPETPKWEGEALETEAAFGPEYDTARDAEQPEPYYPLPEYDDAYRYAGLNQRLTASLADLLLFLLLVWAVLSPFQPQGAMMAEPLPFEVRQELKAVTSFGELFASPAVRQHMALGFAKNSLHMGIYFLVVLACWLKWKTTPGKLILGVRIVDAKTGGTPTNGQFIRRILGYVLETIPLFLGFASMLFNRKKRAFHDKLAGTSTLVDYRLYRILWALIRMLAAGLQRRWRDRNRHK